MIYAICFFVCGFLISVVLTSQAIRLGAMGYGLDTPNETRKRHNKPISRLGGLPVVVTVMLSAIVILFIDRHRGWQWLPV